MICLELGICVFCSPVFFAVIRSHGLARMIRTLAKCGAEIALFGKGQTAPNANARLRSLARRWILGSDVRCFVSGSPGDLIESVGSETECSEGSASSLGTRGSDTQRRVLDQSVSVDGRGSAGLAADGEQVMYLTYLANDLCVLMLRSRVGARLHDGVPTSEVLPSARRAL